MIDIPAGTPLADAILQAQQALQASDYQSAANHYHQAVALSERLDASRRPEVRRALWLEHVGALIEREHLDIAILQCRHYLGAARRDGDPLAEVQLGILLAESLFAQDDLRTGQIVLEHVEALLAQHSLREDQLGLLAPHLMRLRGLVAAEQGHESQAISYLQNAADAFTADGNQRGRSVVMNDRQRMVLLPGNAPIVDEILGTVTPQHTDEVLLYARALRRDARYETAIRLLRTRLQSSVTPRLRFPLLHELVLLYQILADRKMVEALLPPLAEAAQFAADPAEAQAAVMRLQNQGQGLALTAGTNFDARFSHVRTLIQADQLAEAESALIGLRSDANAPRQAALWSLAAGELEFALGKASGAQEARTCADQALGHLARAAQLSLEASLPEIYVQAEQLAGRVCNTLLNDLDAASLHWSQAERKDKWIASRQDTDQARTRYLEARPTQSDALIEAAAERVVQGRADLIAGVVVAIEAARAVAVLKLIAPSARLKPRDLPLPNDLKACWEWYNHVAQHIPRDTIVWLIHATSAQIHHGIVGAETLSWVSVRADRTELSEAIQDLKLLWESPELLEDSVQNKRDFMRDQLTRIADMLRPDLALAVVPKRVRRLAIVAGNMLGEIPFAAMPLRNGNGSAAPLVTRYALSDLPCLSAQSPLQQRSVTARGDRRLNVRPPAPDLPTLDIGATDGALHSLVGAEATIEAFERLLANKSFPLIQVDCHGHHGRDDASGSWLQFASSAKDDGQLTTDRFQSLRLKGCGTLILGACESGMSQRTGRDERLGFVRSALAAGASSIVAARWVAEDRTTAAILARFGRYLRYLPRDQALQQAQLDVLYGRCPETTRSGRPLPQPPHPAHWACWTLYGDAGYQTPANPIARWVRKFVSQRQMA